MQRVCKSACNERGVGLRTRHFRDLLLWQKAMTRAKDVYRATAAFPKEEMFGLKSQMRRAAVSVPSNIAEGHGRLSDHLLRVFRAQARGSLYELETQVLLSRDLEFLQPQETQPLIEQCNEISRMLNGLLAVLKPRDVSR
jgi:four helix bundle protein